MYVFILETQNQKGKLLGGSNRINNAIILKTKPLHGQCH